MPHTPETPSFRPLARIVEVLTPDPRAVIKRGIEREVLGVQVTPTVSTEGNRLERFMSGPGDPRLKVTP